MRQRSKTKRLADWIRCRGGTVHPHLNIFQEKSDGDRVVVAERPIAKGEVLIRLTSTSYFDARAQKLPTAFSEKGFIHAALCTMSYILVKGKDDAYVQCLKGANVHPSDDEIVSKLLSGSSIAEEYVARKPEMTLWYEGKLRKNVLKYPDIWPCDEERIDGMFERVCDLVRSRGFYDEQNRGPFMLPGMDMLNHCNDAKRTSTTLYTENSKDGIAFVMIAERDIKESEEITHTYVEMTDSELFMTYGIVNDQSVVVPRISRSLICRAMKEELSESFGETTMKELGETILSKMENQCKTLMPRGFVSLCEFGDFGVHNALLNIATVLCDHDDDAASLMCRIYKLSLETFDSGVRRDDQDLLSSSFHCAAFTLARREYVVLKSAYKSALHYYSSVVRRRDTSAA